jgi:hypothetical protein
MTTRIGTVAVFKNDPVLAYLDANVPPGQEIFVYPCAPIYYFLSSTTNPTIWSGLGYHYNSPADFQQVVRTLDQHRVQYIVWDTGLEARALKLFFSLKPPRPDERIIEPYIASHYNVVWAQNDVRILQRKSEGAHP